MSSFRAVGIFAFASHVELYLTCYRSVINRFAYRYSSILMLRLGQSMRIYLLRYDFRTLPSLDLIDFLTLRQYILCFRLT